MPVKYILDANDKIDLGAVGLKNATGYANRLLKIKATEDGLDYLPQGAGGGLDADLLDGLQGSAYEQIANKGVASGYASLNASSLVVQNPASKGQANGLAELDASGKIPSTQLPALALTDVWTVASEAAQLALSAQEGDIAIRTDLNKSYAHNGGTSGTMADWSELLTPTDTVLSVFGRTGAVVAQEGDYTLDLLGDVAITTPATGQVLRYGGASWLNAQLAHGDLSGIGTNTHAQLDTHLGASSGVHGITGSVVGTSDAQTLLNKLFGSDTVIKEKGTATAVNPQYDSYDLVLRNSEWYGGAEVQREFRIRNKVVDPASDSYQLQFLKTGGTKIYTIEEGGGNSFADFWGTTQTQYRFRIAGAVKFYFDVIGTGTAFTSNVPLTLLGDNVERLRLDSSGSKFSGPVNFTSLTTGSVPFIGTGGLLTEDNGYLYWDNSSKNLGIGTNSPSARLHLHNQIDGVTAMRLGRFGGSTWGIYRYGSAGNDRFTIGVIGTSEPFNILTDGKIGVGTTTPKFLAHVAGRLGFGVPNSSPTDADLSNGEATAWLDETAGKLKFRIKKSDGTLVTAEVAYA